MRAILVVLLVSMTLAMPLDRTSSALPTEDRRAADARADKQPGASREGADRAKADHRDLTKTQTRIDATLKKALPALVRVEGPNCSGVIVSDDGYVATCAHHFLLPGTKVTFILADRRKVAGEVLGSHRYWDIGLMKITEGENWPKVEFGKSAALGREDLCIALGYPPDSNRPDEVPEAKVRVGRVVYTAAPGLLQTSCLIQAGDSGGPLLDLDGRLVGIHRSSGSINFAGSLHAGAELFGDLWDELAARKRVELVPRGLGEAEDRYRRAIAGGPAITVDVLCDGRPTLLGTIVEPDGWILTKASDLTGRITCRLRDGREFEASRRRASRRHDLAMLKIDAEGLPAIPWSHREAPPIGTLVSAPGCRTRWSVSIGKEESLHVSTLVAAGEASSPAGVVSHSRRRIPAMQGFPLVDLKQADGGFVVAALHQERAEAPITLQVGDIITRIDGKSVPTPKAYEEIMRDNHVAGDRITLTVRRGNHTVDVGIALHPSQGASRHFRLSHRRTGFPDVFSTDLDLRPEMCGGPLVNLSGEVVGINIARGSEIESFAIPSGVVRETIDNLRAGEGSINR